ncbi:MAG: hypothetical protein WD739_11865 [Actinomycetota bacterium]
MRSARWFLALSWLLWVFAATRLIAAIRMLVEGYYDVAIFELLFLAAFISFALMARRAWAARVAAHFAQMRRDPT